MLFWSVWWKVPEHNSSAFFDALIRNRSWSTLVMEAVEEDRRHFRDLFEKDFGSIVERVHAFFEMLFGREAGVGTRVASATMLGLGSLVLATKLHVVEVPVELKWASSESLPVSFAADSKKPLVVAVESPTGEAKIPVRLEGEADKIPIKFQFEAEASAAALDKVAVQLGATNQSLSAALVPGSISWCA